MIHSTLSAAALFLVVDLVAARRGGDFWLRLRPAIGNTGLISALFFATGIAVVGLPPLSGFLGKLMILDALRARDPAGARGAVEAGETGPGPVAGTRRLRV